MKQQSLLSETGGQQEAFEHLKAGSIDPSSSVPSLGHSVNTHNPCYARPSFQPSSGVEQIHFQYLLKAFQLLHRN